MHPPGFPFLCFLLFLPDPLFHAHRLICFLPIGFLPFFTGSSVVKSEKHPEIRSRYLRLRKRRGHKKAMIAIARMLLTALYNMLKNKKPYNAELYRKSDVLPVNREITVEQAILMAQFQGYKVKSAAEQTLTLLHIQFF